MHTQEMWPFQRSRKRNTFFFYFGCVTHNKALDMMRLPLKCIYFYQRIYGVKIIDNRPYATTVSTIACGQNFFF